MKNIRILIDLDDTIENLLDAWVNYLNKEHNLNVKLEDVEYNLEKTFPTLTREEIEYPLKKDMTFWGTVKPKRDAQIVLPWLLDDSGYEIYFVTASCFDGIENKLTQCIFKNFPYINENNLIISNNKSIISGDILIDDNPEHISKFSGTGILVNSPHNKDFKYNLRVEDWYEIYSIITSLYNTKARNIRSKFNITA